MCQSTSISDVTERESLEFPSLAPDESKLSPADSLGNIRSAMVRDRGKNYVHNDLSMQIIKVYDDTK